MKLQVKVGDYGRGEVSGNIYRALRVYVDEYRRVVIDAQVVKLGHNPAWAGVNEEYGVGGVVMHVRLDSWNPMTEAEAFAEKLGLEIRRVEA